MSKHNQTYDLVIIGGGINGVGIAADAAGRGLKVFVAEQNDLGSGTSSNSSKLIHGGLRYLEQYEFSLVKKALAERELLLKNAPHIMKPLTFHLPHLPHLRPKWLIKLGLFLYDNLAKRETLHASKQIHFNPESPLKSDITTGFEYSDVWVDDARLVILNAIAAKQKGAMISPRTQCVGAKRSEGCWLIEMKNTLTDQIYQIRSKGLVNAAGPWMNQLLDHTIENSSNQRIRLVKGSHIIVPKLHQQPQAYMLQNADKRIVFVIPYEQEFSLIGTTDVDFQADPGKVAIDQQEIDYLLNISNTHFKCQLSQADIVHSYSGVRPLLDECNNNAQTVTRDYNLELDSQDQLPLLSVFGGKLTTYRKLAEAALKKLEPFYSHMGTPWTATTPLPGGQFKNKQTLQIKLHNDFPWVWQDKLKRLINCYGTLVYLWLDGKTNEKQLGFHFGAGLYQVEVDYLLKHEWAITAEDIIWRRTKLGLQLSSDEVKALEKYLATKKSARAA